LWIAVCRSQRGSFVIGIPQDDEERVVLSGFMTAMEKSSFIVILTPQRRGKNPFVDSSLPVPRGILLSPREIRMTGGGRGVGD